MKLWMRALSVVLTSRKLKKSMTFGMNYLQGKDDISIDIVGYKYMSTLSDEFTVKLKNLTYSQIVQIISGEYYDIDIYCGYRSAQVNKIFSGGVFYVSNRIDDMKTTTCILICTSTLIARFGQTRLNLSLNSGINMYSALNYICKKAGIPSVRLSEQLKLDMSNDMLSMNTTVANMLEQLTNNYPSLIVNSDASLGSVLSMFDSARSNDRVINCTSKVIQLSQGYPRLTTDGLTMTVFPGFNFTCGDVIKVDNSLIDISVSNKSEVSKNYGYFLDEDGYYMIYQIQYVLQNRGDAFNVEMLCKSRNLITRVLTK